METRLDLLTATPLLYGNTPHTVRHIRDPRHFFTQLHRHKIAYPASQRTPPPPSQAHLWLRKTPSSSGGHGIQPASVDPSRVSPRYYYQKHMTHSRALSMTFLANGKQCVPVGFCQQTADSTPTMPLRFGTLHTIHIEDTLRLRLQHIANTLTRLYGLRGINSLDTVQDSNNLWVVEVNPRPGIALALLDESPMPPLLACHVATFVAPDAPLPKLPAVPASSIVRAIRVIYAPKTLTTVPLPSWACDRTKPNTRLAQGAPLCCLSATGESLQETYALLNQRTKKIVACYT